MIFLIKLFLKLDYLFRSRQLFRDNVIEFKYLDLSLDLFLFFEFEIGFGFIKKVKEKRFSGGRIFIDNNLFVFAFFR